MTKSAFLSLLTLIGISFDALSQNLVPNHSFETVECQTAFFFPFGCPIDNNAPWAQASQGSTDSFNECHTGDFGSFSVPENFQGTQESFGSGSGYAGVMTYEDNGQGIQYREYIQVELSQALQVGVEYELSFYCSLADNSTLASNRLGMLLSIGSVSIAGQEVIDANPQLEAGVITNSEEWTQVSGNYLAAGGETHLTIGNFYSDVETTTTPSGQGNFERAFYFIDEIVVHDPSVTGLSDLTSLKDQMSIRPNPASSSIMMDLDLSNNEFLYVYDAMGRDVSNQVSVISIAREQSHLNVSKLRPGVYTLFTEDSAGTLVKVED